MDVHLTWQPSDRVDPQTVIVRNVTPGQLEAIRVAEASSDPDMFLTLPDVEYRSGGRGEAVFQASRVIGFEVAQ